MLIHLACIWERRVEGKFNSSFDLGAYLPLYLLKETVVHQALLKHPGGEKFERIALAFPLLFLFFGAIVRALYIAHVVPKKAVGVAEKEGRPLALPRSFHHCARRIVNGTRVLAVYLFGEDTKGPSSSGQTARRGFREVGVFVVEVVLADVDHRKLPQRCHVHHFVEQALAKGAIPKETYRYLVAAAHFNRHGGASGDTRAAADDSVSSQITGILVG